MDNLALTYESHSLINQNNFRESLVRDILYYHEQNKIEKRDALLQHITEAETAYLIEQGLIHEIFGRPPSQRGVGGAIKDKIAGAVGGQESGMRNKLVKVYQQVWDEWKNYAKHLDTSIKQQRGLGNTQGQTQTNRKNPKALDDFLRMLLNKNPKHLAIINAAMKAAGVGNANEINDKIAGAAIYKSLEGHYQATQATSAAYTPRMQLPASL